MISEKKIRTVSGDPIYKEKGLPIFGCSKDMLESPLEFISKVHSKNEPIVDINIPLFNMAMVCDATAIDEILNDKSDKFRKSDRDVSILSGLLGEGLITSNGEQHRIKKKRVLPAFKMKHFQRYLEKSNIEVSRYIKSIVSGDYKNVDEGMIQITFMTNMRILFGDEIAEASSDLSKISRTIDELSRILVMRLTSPFVAPSWIPTKENRVVAKLQRDLNDTVDRLIYQRTSDMDACANRNDVLSMLVVEMKSEGMLNINEIRAELLTLFVAGYETTASTINWALYHLSQNRKILERVQKEIDSVDQNQSLNFDQCQSMTYMDMVIRETLRISTGVWVIVDRQANEDVQVGNFLIPKDKTLFLSTYGVHKNPKYFENPNIFDPERFSLENKAKILKGSYFPFGMGKRICIGAGVSVIMIQAVLYGILRNFDVELDPHQKIEEEPNLSLKCKYGLRMKFTERS